MKHLKHINENSVTKTGVLLVKPNNGDYGALMFEDEYAGAKVSDIINNPSEYEGEEWLLEVFYFDNVDSKFVEFIKRNIQDYEMSKDKNFYIEGDVIK